MPRRTLGETIRELRETQNLSLAILAERAQITLSLLAMIESDNGPRPTIAILGRLARALGVTVKTFEPDA